MCPPLTAGNWPSPRSRAGPKSQLLLRPLGRLKQLAARFLAWRAQRETLRILNSVDRATLRDLGITDIKSVVYGAPEGHKRNYDPDWWKRKVR